MKKKRNIAIGLSSVIALSLVGCSSNVQVQTTETKEGSKSSSTIATKDSTFIEKAIYDNALDMQKEDVEGYMDDYVVLEDEVEIMKQSLTSYFDSVDATYEIKKIDILEQTDTMAKVEVTQVTKAVPKTDGFTDNETVTIQTLELIEGKWKFTSSETKSVKNL